MTEAPQKRDWYVTIFQYGVMWPIGLWGVAGIVYYFLTESFGNDELVAAILLAIVAWYRFGPLPTPKTEDAIETDSKDAG